MDIIVKSKNCDVSPRLKEEALSRLQHATRFFDRLVGMEMIFREEHNPRIPEPAVVEVTARTKGHLIRAQGVGGDHRAAVDAAVDRFERQLARYKSRLVDRTQQRRQRAEAELATAAPSEAAGAADTDSGPRIVRRKEFPLAPMLPEDAALQLELLGHEFFLFNNAATGRCGVVYRRRDGQLGLIEAAD